MQLVVSGSEQKAVTVQNNYSRFALKPSKYLCRLQEIVIHRTARYHRMPAGCAYCTCITEATMLCNTFMTLFITPLNTH